MGFSPKFPFWFLGRVLCPEPCRVLGLSPPSTAALEHLLCSQSSWCSPTAAFGHFLALPDISLDKENPCGIYSLARAPWGQKKSAIIAGVVSFLCHPRAVIVHCTEPGARRALPAPAVGSGDALFLTRIPKFSFPEGLCVTSCPFWWHWLCVGAKSFVKDSSISWRMRHTKFIRLVLSDEGTLSLVPCLLRPPCVCGGALGGDERSVVGSAGPGQAVGREFGLCCCAEAAEPCSGSLVLCACPAELISTAEVISTEAILRISLEHLLGQTGFASSPVCAF